MNLVPIGQKLTGERHDPGGMDKTIIRAVPGQHLMRG